jgi:hypothetical protein
MKKNLLSLALGLLLAPACWASVFVAAHADDIALFMARNAWTDVQAGDHTVFILTTASDDGHGDYLPNPTGAVYYRARALGHERALRFWLGSGGTPLAPTESSTVVINGKSVERSVLGGRLTVYYLNLPDGNYDGSGFSATGNQSLAKLLAGSIHSISAVTASNPSNYTLAELQATVRSILLQQEHNVAQVWINMLDEDAGRNPADHADHSATTRLMLQVLASAPLQCANVARYTSYANSSKPANLSAADSTYHSATWAALNSALIDGGNASTWDSTHNGWLGRQYLFGQFGSGSCAF